MESRSWIMSSVIVFEFHEVEQTRGESKEMVPVGELGNGCKCNLMHCRGEVLVHVL